jgi:hypothetical protein
MRLQGRKLGAVNAKENVNHPVEESRGVSERTGNEVRLKMEDLTQGTCGGPYLQLTLGASEARYHQAPSEESAMTLVPALHPRLSRDPPLGSYQYPTVPCGEGRA